MLSELENEIGKNFNMVILLPNEDVPFSYDFFVRDELIASMGVSMGAGFVVPNSTKINKWPNFLYKSDPTRSTFWSSGIFVSITNVTYCDGDSSDCSSRIFCVQSITSIPASTSSDRMTRQWPLARKCFCATRWLESVSMLLSVCCDIVPS
ncbi:hypothetical protein OWV82_003823 [Melia azedarach]|uniref:Uncharacterized protein n=1 Tax=Melia azedarach TaxID=155640 RepID=A0ACC1YN90_MELAZ|nr:hypothetical protein OWV82_003823 [Melia azedarach]